MMERWKNAVSKSFEGEITLPKTTAWLISALILAVGVIYGLMLAPWTHGVRIGCNNISQNDCQFGRDYDEEDEEDDEE